MEYTLCNICGNSEVQPLYTISDYLLERSNISSSFVKCENCGLIFQNPRPSINEINQHYPSEYESYLSKQDIENASWLLKEAIRYGIKKRGRFITRYKKSGRLLDIGCASGLFLNGMREQGNWELYGVEPNEYAAKIAQEQYNLNVKIGLLEEAEYPDRFFDVVTLWDVLEHLHDPKAQMREIHRILKPDGFIIFRVPNANSFDAKIFKHYWAGLDAPRHLYVFTFDTLNKLLTSTGFRIINKNTNSGSYPTFLISLRFYMVGNRTSRIVKQWILKILSHPICRLLTAPLFFIISISSRGPQMVISAGIQGSS